MGKTVHIDTKIPRKLFIITAEDFLMAIACAKSYGPFDNAAKELPPVFTYAPRGVSLYRQENEPWRREGRERERRAKILPGHCKNGF